LDHRKTFGGGCSGRSGGAERVPDRAHAGTGGGLAAHRGGHADPDPRLAAGWIVAEEAVAAVQRGAGIGHRQWLFEEAVRARSVFKCVIRVSRIEYN
jgi:hypothetical protein